MGVTPLSDEVDALRKEVIILRSIVDGLLQLRPVVCISYFQERQDLVRAYEKISPKEAAANGNKPQGNAGSFKRVSER